MAEATQKEGQASGSAQEKEKKASTSKYHLHRTQSRGPTVAEVDDLSLTHTGEAIDLTEDQAERLNAVLKDSGSTLKEGERE